MLQIQNINKEYKTGELVQKALDQVTVGFRDSEFVAVLGPSGSGKTTLLNIIGGLDRYDSGDIIINGTSTKKYKDRDWDSYRNHSIGFVFQSYNLIPHQSILANVELSLTIAGMSRKQRRDKAKRALEEVGLLDQWHKKPNQMSGGQMQRVAIARALVNDPDILLADEPTGALDSETSVQVLELLKKVAANRLVIMVTHNEQLAGSYATRIIKLLDGKITADSDPYELTEKEAVSARQSRLAKVSMSFLSSISLSFNNLRTKKGRTILTAFASSIGIIGIALILALSAGVNNYIFDLQKETMASYPITISAETRDLSAAFGPGAGMMGRRNETADESPGERTTVTADYSDIESDESYLASVKKNNLSLFKNYLDEPSSEIHQYIGENGVVYTYDVNFDVYSYDSEGKLVNSDSEVGGRSSTIRGFNSEEHFNVVFGADTGSGAANFSELMKGTNVATISEVITDSYELLYGSWPENYDEIILVLGSKSNLASITLYQLGLITADELNSMKDQLKNGEELPEKTWTFEELADRSFYLVPSSDRYVENSYGTFSHVEESALGFEKYVDGGIKLKVTGIVKVLPEAANAAISTAAAYTTELTDYLIDYVNNSPVVLAQKATPEINVLSGLVFEAADEEEMIAVASQYVSQLSVSEKASLYSMILSTKAENTEGKATENTDSQSDNEAGMEAGSGPMQMPQQMPGNRQMDEATMAAAMDQWLAETPDDDILLSIYDAFIKGPSYENNMSSFGQVSYDTPASISIYTDSFEAKEGIAQSIANYNETMDESNHISYVDYVEILTSSMTTIINIITYVLIAFVAVSLVVSSIMIGIITYISVLERTKEIGILRALGASKSNISQLFNAETFIIGLISGALGIVVSQLLIIPLNIIIQNMLGEGTVTAQLPLTSAFLLILLSVMITVIGGLFPARKAAKKDPVIALRTE